MRLFVAIFLTLASANAQDVLMDRVRTMVQPSTNVAGPGEVIEFRVDEAGLKAFGEWEPGGGKEPAVTRNQAVKMALGSAGAGPGAEERVLVTLEKVNRWEVGKSIPPAGCSPWFYLIELRDLSKANKVRYFLVTVGGQLAKTNVTD